MQNEAGEVVDVYIPRKCSSSGRIIGAKDHASVQLNVADVDEKTGKNDVFVVRVIGHTPLCNFVECWPHPFPTKLWAIPIFCRWV